MPQIRQGVIIVSGILDLDAKVVLVPGPPFSKVRRMLEISSLPADADRCVEIERQFIGTGL